MEDVETMEAYIQRRTSGAGCEHWDLLPKDLEALRYLVEERTRLRLEIDRSVMPAGYVKASLSALMFIMGWLVEKEKPTQAQLAIDELRRNCSPS